MKKTLILAALLSTFAYSQTSFTSLTFSIVKQITSPYTTSYKIYKFYKFKKDHKSTSVYTGKQK